MLNSAIRFAISLVLIMCGAVLFYFLNLYLPAGHRSASTPAKKTSPATVTVTDDQLITVELTEAAEKRLGIQTASIEIKNLPRFRTYGGEVTLPTGATVIVSAPVTGKLLSPENHQVPQPGAILTEKQPVLALLPVLSPAEKIGVAAQLADAEGLVEQARSQVEANKIDLDRAKLQAEKGVGLGKTLDDAIARLKISEKQLEAAVSRKKILNAAMTDGRSKNDQKPIAIESPQSGILRTLHALPDEFVMAGAPLFEVMKTDALWIRVPVYVGESAEIAIDRPAEVGDLAYRPGQSLIKAQPVSAPPTATALASTVDLYYQLPNPDIKLRPSQRVSVQLPLVGDNEERVVPWSAVVQDIHGGNWVYEQTGEHKFVRRRIQVKRVSDSWAILDRGPTVGTAIVVTGVAELFGTEFGLGK